MRVFSHTCSNTEIVCALGCASMLVGVDAEQKGDGLIHCSGFQVARRIVPPLSGEPPPWLIGWSRPTGTGRRSRR